MDRIATAAVEGKDHPFTSEEDKREALAKTQAHVEAQAAQTRSNVAICVAASSPSGREEPRTA